MGRNVFPDALLRLLNLGLLLHLFLDLVLQTSIQGLSLLPHAHLGVGLVLLVSYGTWTSRFGLRWDDMVLLHWHLRLLRRLDWRLLLLLLWLLLILGSFGLYHLLLGRFRLQNDRLLDSNFLL